MILDEHIAIAFKAGGLRALMCAKVGDPTGFRGIKKVRVDQSCDPALKGEVEFMEYSDLAAKEPSTGPKHEHREGPVARSIEQQTAKLPSDTWLWAAFGSIGASLIFQLIGDDRKANFIGHWAPTFLLLGLYNKMVKLHGSEGV